MISIYTLIIYLYNIILHIAAIGNTKAKLLIEGRKKSLHQLQNIHWENEQVFWFHTASLGEFEQGRPLIEEIRRKHPKAKLVLTFYSPSGYEVRKNYNQVDLVLYLPVDTASQMHYFIKKINPKAIFLVKYEFWYHLLNQAQLQQIPVYSISSIFRKNQFFFTWYGKPWLQQLQSIKHFFVQDEKSLQLLQKHHIKQVSITGDTRFDRVYTLSQQVKKLEFMERFCNNQFTIVAGSTWEPGEKLFTTFINEQVINAKFVIVPHDIHQDKINDLINNITCKAIKYSEIKNQNLTDYQVLIIDTVGLLTSIYQYASLAYVGGAFGTKGIHNVLEPACFKTPVFYGPNFEKFNEAKGLVTAKGAKVVHDYDSFKKIISEFFHNPELLSSYASNAFQFVEKNKGATQKIINYLNSNKIV